jgi:hypothetical protein
MKPLLISTLGIAVAIAAFTLGREFELARHQARARELQFTIGELSNRLAAVAATLAATATAADLNALRSNTEHTSAQVATLATNWASELHRQWSPEFEQLTSKVVALSQSVSSHATNAALNSPQAPSAAANPNKSLSELRSEVSNSRNPCIQSVRRLEFNQDKLPDTAVAKVALSCKGLSNGTNYALIITQFGNPVGYGTATVEQGTNATIRCKHTDLFRRDDLFDCALHLLPSNP